MKSARIRCKSKGFRGFRAGSLRFQQKSPEAPSERASGSRQRLVQLQARANDAVDAPDQHHQAGLEVTMQSNLVHTVQEMYTKRAMRPSTIIEPRIRLPIRLPTVE